MSRTLKESPGMVSSWSRALTGAGFGITLVAAVALSLPAASYAAGPDFGSSGGSGSTGLGSGFTEINVTNDPTRLNGQPV
ncbi:hypothetical protein I0Q12_02030, partial [Rhodococcus sp. CX]|uniref:hypothetical protein n=1 Tax=Rhodococcus sp. CX TaxID=2789880 RepID=UPI0018CE84F5